MAHAIPVIYHDEFGALEHIVMPGQTVADLAGLIAELSAELKPRSFIERMYVRDQALQIALAEFMRRCRAAMVNSLLGDFMRQASDSRSNADTKSDDSVADHADLDAIGKVFAANLSSIEAATGLEHSVTRERDRIGRLFDDRRMSDLQTMLALIEGKTADAEEDDDDGIDAG